MVACKDVWQQETKKTENSDDFFRVEHGHDNPVTSLQCVSFNKSIMYVIMHKEKMPINMLPHSKAPGKTTNCGNRHAKKTRGLF